MTTPLDRQPTPEWSLTLRYLDRPPATPTASGRRASPEVDEEGLAMLLAEVVRSLLQRSPLRMSVEQYEASALAFL